MKHNISWHKECLAASKAYYENEMKILEDLRRSLERDRKAVEFYEAQIAKAEAMGKSSFDADKFMARRKKGC